MSTTTTKRAAKRAVAAAEAAPTAAAAAEVKEQAERRPRAQPVPKRTRPVRQVNTVASSSEQAPNNSNESKASEPALISMLTPPSTPPPEVEESSREDLELEHDENEFDIEDNVDSYDDNPSDPSDADLGGLDDQRRSSEGKASGRRKTSFERRHSFLVDDGDFVPVADADSEEVEERRSTAAATKTAAAKLPQNSARLVTAAAVAKKHTAELQRPTDLLRIASYLPKWTPRTVSTDFLRTVKLRLQPLGLLEDDWVRILPMLFEGPRDNDKADWVSKHVVTQARGSWNRASTILIITISKSVTTLNKFKLTTTRAVKATAKQYNRLSSVSSTCAHRSESGTQTNRRYVTS